MNPPDNDLLSLLGELIKWLSAPLLGLVAWAWNTNRAEHDALRAAHEKLRDAQSTGASKLNDRIMDHIDDQVRELRVFVISEDAKLLSEQLVQRGHIGKIFDKLEEASHRSEDRHRELLTAIHTGLAKKADK